jgi:hypothetical protein
MLLIAPIAVAVFALLSRGVRRVGPELLGVAGIAVCICPILAGVSVWELEPNFGPYTTTLSVLLVLVGLICGIVGTFAVKRVGTWLARPGTERRLSTRLLPIGIVLGLGLTIAAALHARGRPPAAPDALPLVTNEDQGLYNNRFESGGIRVVVQARKVNPTSYWPDTCFMVVTDETAGKDYEAKIGSVATMSGNTSCPPSIRTIDPTRRIVYLSTSYPRAWQLPGFQPTSPTVWTCRQGRLLAAPRDWINAAWISLGIAVLAGLLRAITARVSARRLAAAREAVHEGNGVLYLPDGTRLSSTQASVLPVGPVVMLGGRRDPAATYRSSHSPIEGGVVPGTLLTLTDRSTRRACLASLLGVLALGLALAPLLLGVVASWGETGLLRAMLPEDVQIERGNR